MRDFDIANDATPQRWTDASPEHRTDTSPERWTQATVHRDMWADAVADPREADSVACTDERSNVLEYLRRYRLTLELKCADLDAAQLARRSVPPSTMSLLGLVRHMAGVEWQWFRCVLAGEDGTRPFRASGNRDEEFDGAQGDPECVREAFAQWHAQIAFAESWVDAQPDLATVGAQTGDDAAQLRDILVHMVEEYARHCGHADLLRECIDGRVGQ